MQLLNLEREATLWKTAGALANTGATGVPSDQKMELQPDGSYLFEVDPHQPYGDGYFYDRLLLSHPEAADALKFATHFELSHRITIKKADFPWTRAVEFEIQQTVNGRVSNFSLQGRPGFFWRTYDKVSQKWDDFPTPIACKIQPDIETHVIFNGQKDGSGNVHLTRIVIDNVVTPLDMHLPVLVTSVKDSVNVAFQCDSQKGSYTNGVWVPPPPSRAYVRNINLTFTQ